MDYDSPSMNCPRCGKENPESNAFCGKCGLEFAQYNPTQAPAEARPCHRHPKVMTQLSCGRCDRPICDRCVVLGPAGPRCRECARQSISRSPRTVLMDLWLSVRGLTRMGPFALYLYVLIVLLVVGMLRGSCSIVEQEPPQVESEEG